MKLSKMKVDAQSLEEGIWVDSEEFEGVRWKVRGTDTPGYQRALRAQLQDELLKTKGQANGSNYMSALRAGHTLITEYCLVDWDGIDDDEGNLVPYSPELAKQFAEDDDYFKLARDITWAVHKADGALEEHRGDASGN